MCLTEEEIKNLSNEAQLHYLQRVVNLRQLDCAKKMETKKNMGHWIRYQQERHSQEHDGEQIGSNFFEAVKEYQAYFSNILTGEENFKAVVSSLPKASLEIKN